MVKRLQARRANPGRNEAYFPYAAVTCLRATHRQAKDLQQRKHPTFFYRVVIAIRDVLSDHMHMVPAADFVIRSGYAMVVVGKEKDIEQIR